MPVIFADEIRRPQPDRVTAELMLEAMRAIRHIDDLTELSGCVTADVIVGDRGEIVPRRIPLGMLARSMRQIVLDPRRMICALDKAAESPDWWRANFIHYFNPELSYREISSLTGIPTYSVRDYIERAEIPAECYDKLPKIKG